jgi:putative transposase
MDTLQPDLFYHIYNHANGNDNLFTGEENYRYFLQQYQKYISPIAHTYCYCLMPNHFHWLIRIKEEKALLQTFPKFRTLEKLMATNFISKQLSNLFSSYSQSFNKLYNRKGSLFMKNFNRKLIQQDNYFSNTVAYIHCNPVHHGFVTHPAQWKWSSYNSLLSSSITQLQRDYIISWFGNENLFIEYHEQYLKNMNPLDFDPKF